MVFKTSDMVKLCWSLEPRNVILSKDCVICMLEKTFALLAAGRFKTDLTPQKSSIKLMIQDELTKLADEADDEEDDGDADKAEKRPSGQGVEA